MSQYKKEPNQYSNATASSRKMDTIINYALSISTALIRFSIFEMIVYNWWHDIINKRTTYREPERFYLDPVQDIAERSNINDTKTVILHQLRKKRCSCYIICWAELDTQDGQ